VEAQGLEDSEEEFLTDYQGDLQPDLLSGEPGN
jgi:hypothetical protein